MTSIDPMKQCELAIKSGNISELENQLTYNIGLNINRHDRWQKTLLYYSLLSSANNATKLLILKGADRSVPSYVAGEWELPAVSFLKVKGKLDLFMCENLSESDLLKILLAAVKYNVRVAELVEFLEFSKIYSIKGF